VTELDVIGRGGDTVTLVGDDVVHTFTTVGSANFTVGDARAVQALVVAGGASGTRGLCSVYWGHGGGGGGVSSDILTLTAGSYQATVGAGGAGAATQACDQTHTGGEGAESTVTVAGETLLRATGGLGALSTQAQGGASGAGTIDDEAYSARVGGIGAGGELGCPSPGGECGAGGGGGAGGAGSALDGGPGIASSITGQNVLYGQGGAGRNSSGFGSPDEGAKGPGGGGSDMNGGGYAAGNPGTVILRYPLAVTP
jgi:hypothetical protein